MMLLHVYVKDFISQIVSNKSVHSRPEYLHLDPLLTHTLTDLSLRGGSNGLIAPVFVIGPFTLHLLVRSFFPSLYSTFTDTFKTHFIIPHPTPRHCPEFCIIGCSTMVIVAVLVRRVSYVVFLRQCGIVIFVSVVGKNSISQKKDGQRSTYFIIILHRTLISTPDNDAIAVFYIYTTTTNSTGLHTIYIQTNKCNQHMNTCNLYNY
jgi:hypothetical protein